MNHCAPFGANELSLLHYWEVVADVRVKAMVAKSCDAALGGSLGHLSAAVEAILAGDEAAAQARVIKASRILDGAPVKSFAMLTKFIGFHAFDFYGKAKAREAWLLLHAGLAVLPEEPTLLAALGEIQIREGAIEEGKESLRRALDRDYVRLDDDVAEVFADAETVLPIRTSASHLGR